LTEFIITNRFRKDVKKLTSDGKKKLSKVLGLLEENPDHPSLHIEKITGTDNILSARLSIHLRMTFTKLDSQTLILRRIGTHGVYKKP
jgi:mRNA-degrading endonuclease YafQ of YafQ-DinJ toxin-antitoxin module